MHFYLFKNRNDAGKKLAKVLVKYKNSKDAIVIGLARGGVITAYEVAKTLHLPLDLIIPRKIGAPFNSELAIGALVGEETFLNENIIQQLTITKEYINKEIAKKRTEATKKEKLYRNKKVPLSMKGKTVIIVDDGIATGATMIASILFAKSQKAKKIIVAVPVGPQETLEMLKKLVNEVLFLHIPISMNGISQFYDSFEQITDEEVTQALC